MIRRLHIFVLLFFSIIGYSQQITGIVVEAGSELPIPGATILLKEKSIGTNTDFDGKFTLDNVSDGDIISVSSIGFISKEVLIGSQLNYIIELNEDVAKLDEVVVMGYGTQLKKEVTGSVSIVGSETIEKSNRPVLSKRSRVSSGVNITSSQGLLEGLRYSYSGISTNGDNRH